MLAMDDPHSSHILHIYDPSKLQVRVDVPLADAPAIFVDQRCEVVVDVLPDQTFAGRVLRITHEADIQKNTLQVKVQVIDPSPLLRPEMLTRVRFLPDGAPPTGAGKPSAPDAAGPALVHDECIDTPADGSAPRVWVVRGRNGDDGVVQPVAIRVREPGSPWSLVESTLLPGDLVVSRAQGLTAGLRVRMVELTSSEGAPS
jgi:multidrug efflux pump subunit AcrA (membrane-fusion protein)